MKDVCSEKWIKAEWEVEESLEIFWPGHASPAGTLCVLMSVLVCMCA